MSIPFDLLESRGFFGEEDALKKWILSCKFSDLIDIAGRIAESTEYKKQYAEAPISAHCASLALGGAGDECFYSECRLRKVNQLAQFAVMYSNRTYIYNFFCRYLSSEIHSRVTDSALERQHLYADFVVLKELKPLIEGGVLIPVTPPAYVCYDCLTKGMYGPKSGGRLRRAKKTLAKEYLRNTSVELERTSRYHMLRFSGPDPYYEHPIAAILAALPPSIAEQQRIMKNLKSNRKIMIPKYLQKQLKLHEMLANKVMANISFELLMAQALNTSFVTHQSVHLSFLASAFGNTEIERKNYIASKYLSSSVPFLNDVNVKELLKLREQEADAFILYRHALSEMIREFLASGEGLTEQKARVMYSDYILPQLTKLERRVEIAKRNLIKGVRRSVLAWCGVISFGTYAGLIPTEFIAGAKALGFTALAASGLKKLMAITDAKESIRNEELYFLWKVKQLARPKNKSLEFSGHST